MWDALLIGARLLQFAGALILLGASLFFLYGFKPIALPSLAPERRQGWPRILILTAVAAIAGTILWVMAETVLFSGDPKDGTNVDAVWLVFSETRFGRVCLERIGLLVLSVAASFFVARTKTLAIVQTTLASLIVATFAWTGHGAMSSGGAGALHLGGDLVHLWAAGIWFGALVPLMILVQRAFNSKLSQDAHAARYGLERFSTIGTTVVVTLVVTGLVNSWFLIGVSNWGALFTTAYGTALLVKISLFVLMLGLAAANRFWLTPKLRYELEEDEEARNTSASLRALKTSICIETSFAILLLLAVGVLGTLAPPMSGE